MRNLIYVMASIVISTVLMPGPASAVGERPIGPPSRFGRCLRVALSGTGRSSVITIIAPAEFGRYLRRCGFEVNFNFFLAWQFCTYC